MHSRNVVLMLRFSRVCTVCIGGNANEISVYLYRIVPLRPHNECTLRDTDVSACALYRGQYITA